MKHDLFDEAVFALTQEPIGINFTSPTTGESLSGNTTIKVNATVIVGADVMLRWNNDSWINLTDSYNATSRLYEYTMDVGCLPTGNVTFETKQVTSHGTIQSSVEAYIDWERPPILIVDDFYNTTVTLYYTSALEALGYHNGTGYDVWRKATDGSPSASDLLDYQIVIWYKSADSSAISLGDQNSIQTFLMDSSPRKMLLTGTEIAWTAYLAGYEAWLSSNFGVNDYIGDGSNSEDLVGYVGGPFFGATYSYGGGNGSRALGGADWVRTVEFSQGVIEYASSGFDEFAATLSPYVYGMFFGFAFDAISSQSDRIDLMNRTSPLQIEWNSSSDIPGALYSPSYRIFVDGQQIVSDLLLDTYSADFEDGNHTIRIVCEDNYGQRGYTSVSIEIDAVLPQIIVLSHEEGSVLKSNTSIDFGFIDDHFSHALARWDSDMYGLFSPPYTTMLPVGNGNHSFDIIAFDTPGNGNFGHYVFICDDNPPDVALTDLVNGSVIASDVTISLEINDTHFDRAVYHWDLNADTEFSFPFEVSVPSGDGTHSLWINATDIAGNQRVVNYQFVTDDTLPVISLMGIANGTILKSGSPINLIFTDTNFKNMGYQWDLAETIYYDESDMILYAPPLEGEHWLYVNTTDEAGNTASAYYMFIVDNTAPEISILTPVEGSSIPGGTQVTIDVSDLYLELVFFKWDSGAWSQWNTPYVTYSPTGIGYHALFVNATDIAGNVLQVVFVFLTADATTTITTTTSTTTSTIATTEPSGPSIDIPASLGIMGIGIYLGIILGIFVWPRLRSGKTSGS
jgi:hypothetical protein